jgi:hypothetical protein
MFEKTLEFKNAIILCYGKQKYMVLQQKVPKTQMWVVTKATTFALNLVVSMCVLNQSNGH